jgi:transposase
MQKVRCVGLDVHAETIAVAVAEPEGEVRALGVIPNRPEAVRKLMRKLAATGPLRVCHEAGPTGYVVYWQLTALGIACDVVAPSLVPIRAGDRVKTDRRDAVKVARCYRAGDLAPVWVPDAAHEALRDLVRAREAAKQDQLRARHRLGESLLRPGRRHPQPMTPWTERHLAWITHHVRFPPAAQEATLLDYLHEVEHAAERVGRLERAIDAAGLEAPPAIRAVVDALQALRGKAKVSAVTIVAEVGRLSRFPRARPLMSYAGLWCAKPRVARVTAAGGSPRPAMPTYAASSSRRRGPIVTAPRVAGRSGPARRR